MVSSRGRIKSLAGTGKRPHKEDLILKQFMREGYKRIRLCKYGIVKAHSIARIVAMAFLQDRKETVNNKDGNKENNDIENLEWMTHKENIRHAIETGLRDNKGENCGRSKLKRTEVKSIRKLHRVGIDMLTLSKMFKVARSSIRSVIIRHTWKHVLFDFNLLDGYAFDE